MLKLNFINEEIYNQTYDDPIITKEPATGSGIAPHFTEMVRQQLQKDPRLQGYDIYRDGLRIFTTIDTRMQSAANRAVDEHLEVIQKQFNTAWNWKSNSKLLSETIKKEALRTNLYRAQPNDEERKKVLNYWYRRLCL
jgi:penicillin-binding protein 1A